jgi:hypothetical protein
MAQLGRAALKQFFETGDQPTQAQFEDLIDSIYNLTDDGAVTNPLTKVYHVDASSGDDTTAEVGNINKPWQTVNAACVAADGTGGLVLVWPGTYPVTSTINQNNLTFYAMPGATLQVSSSIVMFNLSNSAIFNILGHGVYLSSGQPIFVDLGNTTGNGRLIEFDKAISTSNDVCFFTRTLSVGESQKITIKGNLVVSYGYSAITLGDNLRNYEIYVFEIKSTAEQAIQISNSKIGKKIKIISKSIESSVKSAITISTIEPIELDVIADNLIGNFLGGFYSVRYTNTATDYSKISIKTLGNGWFYFEGKIRTKIDSIQSFVINNLTDAETKTDTVVFATVSGGKLTVDTLGSLTQSGGRVVITGDMVANSANALVEISAGDLVFYKLIQNTNSVSSTADAIKVTGNCKLEQMPGCRIKCSHASAYPINIASGSLTILQLGVSYVNQAINGTPVFTVNTASELQVNTGI